MREPLLRGAAGTLPSRAGPARSREAQVPLPPGRVLHRRHEPPRARPRPTRVRDQCPHRLPSGGAALHPRLLPRDTPRGSSLHPRAPAHHHQTHPAGLQLQHGDYQDAHRVRGYQQSETAQLLRGSQRQ